MAAEHERVATEAMRRLYPDRGRAIGGGLALRRDDVPDSPMLNRVVGLGVTLAATERDLDDALAAMRDVRHYVAVSPLAAPPDLAGWLEARGYTPGWGWMRFSRDVSDPLPVDTDLAVAALPAAPHGPFGELVATAYGLPPAAATWAASLPEAPGWHAFLALSDGEPAAAGAIYVEPPLAYLGLAATAAAHRRRGGQAALLRARIALARELGCTTVLTETGERLADRPSDSYRNILRAGFREEQVTANWLSPG